MEDIWNSQEFCCQGTTVKLFFCYFFPGQKMRSCLCFPAVSSGGNYWICCIFFFSVPQSAGSAVLSQLAFSKLLLPHNWPPCSSLRFLNANRFVFQQTLIRQKLGRRSWRWCWKPGISSTSPEGSSTRATASLTLTRCTSPSPLTRRTAGGICCKR